MARAVRSFPLGTSQGRLVVLEIAHDRDRARGGREGDDWKGRARLAFVSLRTHERAARVVALGEVLLSDKQYARDLKVVLLRAHRRARRLPGYQALAPPTINFCDFKPRCGALSLAADPAGLIQIQRMLGRRQVTRTAPYPPEVTANPNLPLMSGSYAEASLADRRGLARSFRISSVRRWRVGARSLLVVNLAVGGLRFAYPHLKSWPRARCRTAHGCAFPEPTLHHGTAYDALVWY
jgi:hypothetical protein